MIVNILSFQENQFDIVSILMTAWTVIFIVYSIKMFRPLRCTFSYTFTTLESTEYPIGKHVRICQKISNHAYLHALTHSDAQRLCLNYVYQCENTLTKQIRQIINLLLTNYLSLDIFLRAFASIGFDKGTFIRSFLICSILASTYF